MKKINLVLALLVLFSFTACSKKETTTNHLDRIMEKGELVIGTEGDWAPWTYEDENGVLVGYDVEVGKAIADKLGVKATFVESAWEGLLMALDNETYDLVINGVDITAERQEKYDFSTCYAYSNVALIVRSDNEDIKTLEDLNGKTFSNSAGSSYEYLGESYGATNKPIKTFADTMLMLEEGKVDATINSLETYEDYIKDHQDSPTKVVLETNALDTAIPFPKGEDNKTFYEAVNKAIEELKAEGVLTQLSIKYFGKDITTR